MPNQRPETPMLLRMFHPTSGRQGFNEVTNQMAFPSQSSIDPRLAMPINMQTQQAIDASAIPHGVTGQGFMNYYYPSSYNYGISQPYQFFPRR
ncbi:unnamed protein product [Rotaria sordida]|uniref:Uncharacterized protein n=1 Tax=Rotaria sordida TaxID=392033 RepID=A0A819GYN3_9BILA|nr:unnamed protein product [Rotaria sordida]CAF1032283.1 unnamed protein product [Rotaria sordida]CAF3761398.1 unnamed protein product [Rotaria sordida]CAF3887156.1 unnamed protein product [Rotaria sordida]